MGRGPLLHCGARQQASPQLRAAGGDVRSCTLHHKKGAPIRLAAPAAHHQAAAHPVHPFGCLAYAVLPKHGVEGADHVIRLLSQQVCGNKVPVKRWPECFGF